MSQKIKFTLLLIIIISILISCTENTKPDTTPPTVVITYPANNSEFTQGEVITITSDANDVEGIEKVEFYIDGTKVSTDYNEPYAYDWDTGDKKNDTHTIYAKAFDTSNNSASSDVMTITLKEINIIPPSKVTMTPHMCDPGDPNCTYTDRNNGIDAYPAGSLDYNWMKIQWDDTPLQKDGDIHHIEIWRFNEFGDTTFVEQIPFVPDSSTYYDKFIGYEEPVIQKTWSYFIIPFDEAGNFTKSDTVSYRLIAPAGLQAPANNNTYSVNDPVHFSWTDAGGYTYRILFYDISHTLQFSKDLIPGETECDIPDIFQGSSFSPIPGQSYIWRIDAFTVIGEPIGSESEERTIEFTFK